MFEGRPPFGFGLSTCTDAINVAGVVIAAYGAEMVDRERRHHGQIGRDAAGAGLVSSGSSKTHARQRLCL